MFIISKKLTVQKTVFNYHVRDKKIRRIVAMINEVIKRFIKTVLKLGDHIEFLSYGNLRTYAM